MFFGPAQDLQRKLWSVRDVLGDLVNQLNLVEKPRVYPCGVVNFLDRKSVV